MWEELKVYKQLEKADINQTFKKFGNALVSLVEGYLIDQQVLLSNYPDKLISLSKEFLLKKAKALTILK